MSPAITISLVVWNGGVYLQECLKSLLSQNFNDYELLILDNASTDDSIQVIEAMIGEFGGRARLTKSDENIGFAQGHNRQIAMAQSEFVLVLNQDVILMPDYLQICSDFLHQHPRAAAVCGKLLRWKVGQEDGLKVFEKTNIIDTLGLKLKANFQVVEMATAEIDNGRYQAPLEVFGLSGTAPLYRLSALREVAFDGQYFDGDFFMYKEDVDLSFRLRWAGWQSWTIPAAVAYHDRTAVSLANLSLARQLSYRQKKSARTNRDSYRNHLLVLLKNLNSGLLAKYWLSIFAYEIAKALYLLFTDPQTLGQAVSAIYRQSARTGAKRKFIFAGAKAQASEFSRWIS